LWGASQTILERPIVLNGESYTVVGVMPANSVWPESSDIWLPLAIDYSRFRRGTHFLNVIGRLKRGVSVQAARADMQVVAQRLQQQFPDTNTGRGISLIDLRQQTIGRVRTPLWVLLAAVTLLLLIACLNVASLQVAQATARRQEVAMRYALGAPVSRLVRQCITESILLVSASALCGFVLARWAVAVVPRSLAAIVPRANQISIDGGVVVFSCATALLFGVACSVAPALRVASKDLAESLNASAKPCTPRRDNARHLLIVLEVALTLVLLIGAGLLMNSFFRLSRVNIGFDPRNLLTAQISLSQSAYGDGHLQISYYDQAINRISPIPGVDHVAAVSDLPFSGSRTVGSFEIEGRSQPNLAEPLRADSRTVTPGYFETTRIPLVGGRDFSWEDNQQSHGVAIINVSMAKRYWPDSNPIGKRLIVGSSDERAFYGGPIWREIIGIAGDIRHVNLNADPVPEIYLPLFQCPSSRMSIVIRTSSEPISYASDLRDALKSVDPAQPVYNITTMQDRIARSISTQRIDTLLFGSFALTALILSSVGIYGVVTYSAAQRSREIAIRLALGARSGEILRMIVLDGMSRALFGSVLGVAGALALSRLLSTQLFGVSSTDAGTFGALSVFLLLVALLACYVPARRACTTDPMIVLKNT
ncbi:MAG: ABC transporter permease, partial [Blastocatellia bacterium]